MTHPNLVSWLAALMLGAFGCGLVPLVAIAQEKPSFESRFAELIQRAKADGEVAWYQGLLEAPGKDFSAHFQQRFGIKVQHQFLNSGPIYERFRAESASGRHIADVFSVADTGPMLEAIKAGYIAKFDSASKGEFPKGWVLDQPNGTAYPTQRVHMSIGYNTQLVKPEDAQLLSSWKGLLDARFADGAVSISDPRRTLSAVPAYYYWNRVKKDEYGMDFMRKLAAQKPVIFPSQTQQSARLGAGEFSLGVMVDIVSIQQYNLGAPVAFAYPDPSPVVLQYSGVSQNAPHPNAARLFMEYLNSEEGLGEYKRFSGGFTGRPELDEKIKTKYALEPWYRSPKNYFLIEDWDKANKEYQSLLSEWASVFDKK
jgi:iron(III) transport system substrate-binding protein